VAAGYEVHVNLSPVIVADGRLDAWDELLGELDAGTGPAAKAQMGAEVIFLTHNDRLHEVNLGWHPRAEELLWTPETQEPKRSQTGGWNVRYRRGWKGARVRDLLTLIKRRTPGCACATPSERRPAAAGLWLGELEVEGRQQTIEVPG